MRGDAGSEVQGVGRDVTDRVEAERALSQARDEARSGRPRQVAISRHRQPRDPHPAQRHARHGRALARHAVDAGAGDLRQGGQDLRRDVVDADRGDPRFLQDRGRQARTGAASLRAGGADRGRHRITQPPRASQRHRNRIVRRRAVARPAGGRRRDACARCCSTSPATPSSSPKPAASPSSPSRTRPTAMCAFPCATPASVSGSKTRSACSRTSSRRTVPRRANSAAPVSALPFPAASSSAWMAASRSTANRAAVQPSVSACRWRWSRRRQPISPRRICTTRRC